MKVTAYAPASIGNTGIGFDIIGIAIENPGDIVSVEWNQTDDVRITEIIGEGAERISTIAEKNTAGVAAIEFLKTLKQRNIATKGVNISIHKKMAIGSGLGSSAASAVASAVAINKLFGNPFTRREMLPFVVEAERVACNSAHADNVAPSLLGGIVLLQQKDTLNAIELPVPSELWVTAVHPDFEINTKDARAILPQSVPLRTFVVQSSNVASFVSSLYTSDYTLLANSLHEIIIEPPRSKLIPHFEEIKKSSFQAGALSFNIAGSGPTVFSFSKNEEIAIKSGDAITSIWNKYQVETNIYISKINKTGAKILSPT